MTTLKKIEVKMLMTEMLTRTRDLVKQSCEICFNALDKTKRFDKTEGLIAVNTACDGACEKLLAEVADRYNW